MLIVVSLTLDISLHALLVMQGTVPVLAATSRDKFPATLATFPQLLPLVPDGFSGPGSWIPTRSLPQKGLKI